MDGYRSMPIAELEWKDKGMKHPWSEVGTLDKLGVQAMISQLPMTKPNRAYKMDAKVVYADMLIDNLQRTVFTLFAKHFHCEAEGFDAKGKVVPYSVGRAAYVYFARIVFPRMTLKELSRTYKNITPHWSTIIFGCRMIENLIKTNDPKYMPVLQDIAKALKVKLNQAQQ